MTKKNPKGTVLARGSITYPADTPGCKNRPGLAGSPDMSGVHRLTDVVTGVESKGFWLSHSEAKRAWSLAWSSAGKWDNEIEIVSYPVAGYVAATRYGVRRSTRLSPTEVTPTTTKEDATMKKPSDDLVHYSGKIEEYKWTKTETGNRRMIVSFPSPRLRPLGYIISPDLVQVVEEAFNTGREVEIYVPCGVAVRNDTQFLVRFKPTVTIVARGVPCGYHFSRAAQNNPPYFTVEMPDPVCMYKCYGPISLEDKWLVKQIVDNAETLAIEVYVDPKTGDLRVRRAEK